MEKSSAHDATALSLENAPALEQTNSQTSTDSQTSSQEAIRASPTLPLVMQLTREARRLQVSSSELLMSFARGLCYVRTQLQNSTQMDLGIDFEEFSNPLATLLSPSESEPVVLALTFRRERVFLLAELQESQCKRPQGYVGEVLARPEEGRQDPYITRPNRWYASPRICGTADGIPNRVDRLRAVSNAVSPQVGELIGRNLLRAIQEVSFG